MKPHTDPEPSTGTPMILAAWDVKEWAAVLAPGIALFIGVITLLVNGERAERRRRRELHARGLAAAIAYAEMPFAIRRRQHEPEHRSAERVRLTDRFSEIQAEISVCQALIEAEGDPRLAPAYRELVEATRRIAGVAAREAWNDEPIERDPNVNMAAVAQQLQSLAASRAPRALRRSDTPRSPLAVAQVPQRNRAAQGYLAWFPRTRSRVMPALRADTAMMVEPHVVASTAARARRWAARARRAADDRAALQAHGQHAGGIRAT